MEIFSSVYRHIVALGGLTRDDGDSAPCTSLFRRPNWSPDEFDIREKWAREVIRARECVAELLLQFGSDANAAVDPSFGADLQCAVECYLPYISDLSARLATVTTDEQRLVGDIISSRQIEKLGACLEGIQCGSGTVATACADGGGEGIAGPESPAVGSNGAGGENVGAAGFYDSTSVSLEQVIDEPKYIYADILIALAQVDGKIDPKERRLLDGIFSKMVLEGDILARMWLTPRTTDVIGALLTNVQDLSFKCCLLKDCYLLAYADREFADEERSFLTYICSTINLGWHLEEAIHDWSKTAIEQNRKAEMLFGSFDLSD